MTSTFVRQTRENTFLMVVNSGAHSKEPWVLRDGLCVRAPKPALQGAALRRVQLKAIRLNICFHE